MEALIAHYHTHDLKHVEALGYPEQLLWGASVEETPAGPKDGAQGIGEVADEGPESVDATVSDDQMLEEDDEQLLEEDDNSLETIGVEMPAVATTQILNEGEEMAGQVS